MLLRSAWSLLVFLVTTPVCAFAGITWSLARGDDEMDLRPARIWSRWNLAAAGARVTYEGLEHARPGHPVIFVSNHASTADIWALILAVPRETKFVAKESLFRVPALGWAMKRAGYIPIDRADLKRARQSLRLAAERIRQGRPVIVFPEGTRSKTGRLKSFKKGSFHLALSAGVPLVPVAIHGAWDVLPPGTWRVRSGPILVRFLPPIDATAYPADGYRQLMSDVHAALAAELDQPAAPSDEALATGLP